MSDDHYYAAHPQSESNERQLQATLRGHTLSFHSDSGVFSRDKIDYGTELLIKMVQAGHDDRILDLGCGYGPIGLSLAKEKNSRHVVLVDINFRAVHLTARNAELNTIRNITVFQSDLFTNIPHDERFDLIITNPPIRAGKATVYTLFEQSFHYLKQNGSLWIVIQKKQGALSARKKLEQLYVVNEVTRQKGYFVYQAIKKQITKIW